MPDHVLQGKWTTRVIRASGTIVDGDLDLDITPPKTFKKGKHKGNELKALAIDDRTIELEELEGTKGTLKVKVVIDLPEIGRKVFIGSAVFPQDAKRPESAGQQDGIWVGTQP